MEDNFEIVAPPLTLAKTVPKSYETDTTGLILYNEPNVIFI